nr:putative RNA-directed DNA polymerase, eukaryota, reverse transcriptase zinc-binding domain protein [Tanacetum cinerariifolium]
DNKISWIAWDKVIEPCDRGGLGIGSLRTCNQAMLPKWWWRPHSRAYGDSEITLSSPTNGLAKTSCSMTSTFYLSTGSSELFIHSPELSVSPLKSRPAADSD